MHRLYGALSAFVVFSFVIPTFADDDDRRRDAAKEKVIRGRIVQVDAGGKQITVQTRDKKDVMLEIDNNSRLEIDDRPAKVTQFEAGRRVKVRYAAEPGGKYRAVNVSAVPPAVADLRREMREVLTAAKGYTFQQKEEYQSKLESVLATINDRIDDLQDRAEDASADAKKEMSKEIEDLRKRREVVENRLAKVKSASAEAWEDVKSGVNAAIDELQTAFDRARSRFK